MIITVKLNIHLFQIDNVYKKNLYFEILNKNATTECNDHDKIYIQF